MKAQRLIVIVKKNRKFQALLLVLAMLGLSVGGAPGKEALAQAVCPEGEITETCLCAGIEQSSGYCCTGIWDQNACRILNYGFEDWTGNMYTTPGYPFTSGYSSYMDDHEAGSEVITSYNADEMAQTWTAHSGEYFLIQNDSSTFSLNPSVSGITGGSVNLHNNIGYNGTYGGQSDFDMDTAITTGEVFVSVWARFNKGWYAIQDGGRNKWFRFYANPNAVENTVYMHLSTSSVVSPAMYFCIRAKVTLAEIMVI